MGTLHGIRLAEGAYEVDVEWGEPRARGWYRIELEDGVIVPRLPREMLHLHGWLLRPLTAAFVRYLRGAQLELPLDLES